MPASAVSLQAPCIGSLHKGRASALALVFATLLLGATLSSPARALAAANPRDTLIYMPYGLVHFIRPPSEVDGYLAEVDSYGIGQVLLAMPRFKKTGILKPPRHNTEMLTRWSSRAAAYNAGHGTNMTVTVVFNGNPNQRTKALDLDDPATRANMVSSVQSALATGVSGVQLDIEPFPATPGFITLLEQLDAMFARAGFDGRFSVVAPSNTATWSPSFLRAVSQLVTQIDPTFYDSEFKSSAGYEAWMTHGLAYYTANVSPTTRIVPVLPSYSANRWHTPSVENIETATAAVSDALSAGSRINGAGIWSGWGFLLDEEGAYDGSSDRAAWRSSTASLPYSP